MPHQCVKCQRILPMASKELLEGCSECGGRFFFYIREEQLAKLRNQIIDIPKDEVKRVEKDIREIAGIREATSPVILDFESIRITGEGKFEIDLPNLFNRKKPVIYKLEEGKYIIDLATTLSRYTKEDK